MIPEGRRSFRAADFRTVYSGTRSAARPRIDPGMRSPLSLRAHLPEILALALGAGWLLGLTRGLASGRRLLGAGFSLVAADSTLAAVDRAALAAAGFLLAYALVYAALFSRGLPVRWSCLGATLLAAAPWALLWAHRFNRERGLRPADLLEPHGLLPNLRLLGLCLAVVAALYGLLLAWSRRRLETGRRLGPAPAVVLGGALLLAHGALAAGTAAGSRGAERPNVILVLVDALRADHLGSYGYARDTSPALDAFAREAVLFEEAITQSTFTKSSIASLFTGRAPYEHGVYWGDRRDRAGLLTSDVLLERETTLAEALRSRGYLTAAWVQNTHLRSYMGFAQGFLDYRDQQGNAERINRRFLGWLRGPARLHELFAYLHYIDLHDPYLPEPPYDRLFGEGSDFYEGIDLAEWGAFLEGVRQGRIDLSPADVEELEALYDGQIRYLDDRIGRLFEELKALDLYDRSLIVVTSDHGDAFLEHGFISHSAVPYEELIRVPLLVKLPGGRHGGRRVGRQVRLIDVFPTVLDLLEIPGSRRVSGCSLVPWIEGSPEAAAENDSCAVAVIEIAEEEGEAPTLALRAGGFKYIRGPAGEELYDLGSDQEEAHDLAATAAPEPLETFRRLAGEIEALRSRSRVGSVVLDETTVRELKALGYVD